MTDDAHALVEQRRSDEAGERRYRDILDQVRERLDPADPWLIIARGTWTYCEAPGYGKRHQGWKIHVSATPDSAEAVLERVFEVLLALRATFKFARGPREVRELVAIRCDRGASGKVVTVYPDDDAHFRELAERLDAATAGLDGPAILSDRPYRPGSLVHYRYGSFTGELVHVTTEGSYAPMLIAPDGTWAPDERKAWFSPPAWAPDPFPREASEPTPETGAGNPVLLDGRFVVRVAIRHSNRGGVYRAHDERTGEQVIIKQARPHVGGDVDGKDARDWMRHEAEMLDLLAPEGVTPRKVSLFDYQDHRFLAEEVVSGVSLRQWALAERRERPEGHPALEDVVDLVRRVVAMVRTVHGKGLVLRDLNPSNIMLTPDGDLRLIDPEFMARPGEPVMQIMTPGFAPPDQEHRPRHGPAPGTTVDLYALGASILFLCSAIRLDLPADDESTRRPHADRVHAIVRAAAETNPLVRAFVPLLLRLLAGDPSQRASLDDVDAFADRLARTPSRPEAEPGVLRLLPADHERLLDDTLDALVDAMTPDSSFLWPKQRVETQVLDPCALHGGAAGPIEVLRRALEARGDERLREPLGAAVRWMAQRLSESHRLLPGLYFGRAGSAWALYEAAATLGEAAAAEQALGVARRLPTHWPNPDVMHGLAGAGTAQLHLWRRTGDPELRHRALACAQRLVDWRERRAGGVVWPIAATPPSALGGSTHYGFGHGVAGVSAFLLAAGQELGRADLVEVAREGAATLAGAALRSGDAVVWPSGPADDGQPASGAEWWCSGAAGIGLFLLRVWQATGEERLLELAHGASVAVRRERWSLSPVHCHGLVGSGEFLLDMAAATGDAQYLRWAEEHAALLHLRHGIRDGRRLIFGESPQTLGYSYSLGLAGVAAFLLRLGHGGPRSFMVDDSALEVDASSLGGAPQTPTLVGLG